MDCKEFREILDLYADHELSPDASTEARIHLKECPSCRRAERELLRLRRALKLTVAQHQPPPDLVNAVRRIAQPRWRRLLGIGNQAADAGTVVQSDRPLWRENIRLPIPVFVLLLVAIVTFGIFSARLRMTGAPQSSAGVQSKAVAIKPVEQRSPVEAADVSRFDHGGRASLYKEQR